MELHGGQGGPRPEPRTHSTAPSRPGETRLGPREARTSVRETTWSGPQTQTQAGGNTGRGESVLGTNQPLGRATSQELADPVLACQVCELGLSERAPTLL